MPALTTARSPRGILHGSGGWAFGSRPSASACASRAFLEKGAIGSSDEGVHLMSIPPLSERRGWKRRASGGSEVVPGRTAKMRSADKHACVPR